MIFRLSQKLATKLHVSTLSALPADANPYADWSAHLFTADRTQHIIISNTKSLYSAATYGKGITDSAVFIDRALSTIRDFMEADKQAFAYHRFIAPASVNVRFAKMLDRAIIGSINELVKSAKFRLEEDEVSPFDVAAELNEVPMTALGRYTAETFGIPNEVFRAMMRRQK